MPASEYRVASNGLLLQLVADLRTDDLHVADTEVGGEETLLQAGNHRRRSDIAQRRKQT